MSEEKPIGEYPGIATRLLDELCRKTEIYLSEGTFSEQLMEQEIEEIREWVKEKIIDSYQLGWRVGYSFHKKQEEGKL